MPSALRARTLQTVRMWCRRWAAVLALGCGAESDDGGDAPADDETGVATTTASSTPTTDGPPDPDSGPTPGDEETTTPTPDPSDPSGSGSEDSSGGPPVQPPPAECGDSALQAAAAQLGAGEFAVLETNGLTDDLMDAGNGHWITQYTFKGVFDPTWCRVLFTGGGHLSYVKFVSYDVASNTWQREPDPNWWCDPFDVPDDPWPCVGHAYGHNALDVEGNRYFYKHGGIWEVEVQGAFGTEWTQLPGHEGGADNFTSFDYFPELGALALVTYGFGDGTGGLELLYDGATSWERIPGPFPMGAYHIYSVYNPVEAVFMFGSGNGSSDWNVLHADGTVEAVAPSPGGFHPEPNDDAHFKVLTADPLGGDFLGYAQGGSLWRFDLAANAWSDTATTLPADLELAVQIPDYGVVLFVDGRNNQVVVYKHSG